MCRAPGHAGDSADAQAYLLTTGMGGGVVHLDMQATAPMPRRTVLPINHRRGGCVSHHAPREVLKNEL